MKERMMEWLLNRSTNSVHVGIITIQGYNQSGPLVIGLYLDLIGKDVLTGENLMMARTFLNQFVKDDKNYLVIDFKTPCWVHSMKEAVVEPVDQLCPE